MLSLYRQALQIRRSTVVPDHEPLTWLPAPDGVLHFRRGERFQCLVNLSEEPVALAGHALMTSVGLDNPGVVPSP